MPAHTFAVSKIPASATPEEAAAVVAAIEHFMRATAPTSGESAPAAALGADGWHATALLEGVQRDPWTAPTDAWFGTGSR
jgi:hypothetical protein